MATKDDQSNYNMPSGPRASGPTEQAIFGIHHSHLVSPGSSRLSGPPSQTTSFFNSLPVESVHAPFLDFQPMLGPEHFHNSAVESWQRPLSGLDDTINNHPGALKAPAAGGDFSSSQTLAVPTWPTPSVSVLSSTGSELWAGESDQATIFARSTSGETNTTFTTSTPRTSGGVDMMQLRASTSSLIHRNPDFHRDMGHQGWTYESYSASSFEPRTLQASGLPEIEGSIHDSSHASSVRPEDDPNASIAGENEVIDIRDFVPTSPKSTTSSRPDHLAYDDGDGSHGRNSQLYNALPDANGKYHCYFEGRSSCSHPPTKLKCNYDKYIDSHLKPYRCKVSACRNLRFSSTACRLRHEREAHGSHGHGVKPYPCLVPGCERAQEGNGFPRSWNRNDHMKRCHPTFSAKKEKASDHHDSLAAPAPPVEKKVETGSKKNSKKRQHASTNHEPEKRRRTERTVSAPNMTTAFPQAQAPAVTSMTTPTQPPQATPRDLLHLEWLKWHHSFQHHCRFLRSVEEDESILAIKNLQKDLYMMEKIHAALRDAALRAI